MLLCCLCKCLLWKCPFLIRRCHSYKCITVWCHYIKHLLIFLILEHSTHIDQPFIFEILSYILRQALPAAYVMSSVYIYIRITSYLFKSPLPPGSGKPLLYLLIRYAAATVSVQTSCHLYGHYAVVYLIESI